MNAWDVLGPGSTLMRLDVATAGDVTKWARGR